MEVFNLIDLLHHGHIAHADRNGEIKLPLSPRSLQLDLVSCVRAVRGEDNLSSPLTAQGCPRVVRPSSLKLDLCWHLTLDYGCRGFAL